MEHPSRQFIKFLLLQPTPSAQENAWVQDQVVSVLLPRPPAEYLELLRRKLDPPANFQPDDPLDEESAHFLKKEKVWGLFHPDRPVEEANDLLANLRLRPAVEKLLLGGEEPFKIAQQVNERLDSYLTADGIQTFRHYYWNPSIVAVQDWPLLIPDLRDQQNALSILRSGPEHAYRKAGFRVIVQSKSVLRRMVEGLAEDFEDWMAQPTSREKSRALVGLATAAVKLDDQLQEGGEDLEKIMKLFERTHIETRQVQATPVNELAEAGTFSRSGVPLVEMALAEHEEEIDEQP
jgi:hypothetical protein